jgi:hypothetical protein
MVLASAVRAVVLWGCELIQCCSYSTMWCYGAMVYELTSCAVVLLVLWYYSAFIML